MKVLVIGGGGREHALAWALKKSARVSEVVCMPGNAGIAELARCVPVAVTDLEGTLALVEREQPGLVVIGPEVPLALGVVDLLEKRGVRVFGPTADAAQLESSKAFAKEFMRRFDIPTAAYAVCRSVADVEHELKDFASQVVVKADGLAAGKGVVMCESHRETLEAAGQMFDGVVTGEPIGQLVIEETLVGPEISFFAVCDGTHAATLGVAQDHKRVGEGDTGPNTGGMGAYSTDSLVTPDMIEWLRVNVAQKVVDGMRSEGMPFVGVLFCGMMLTPDGPKVLEFNTRFGDPETQALMLRLETDLLTVFEAAIDGRIDSLPIRMKRGASVCVIAASGGYPGSYTSGKAITGVPVPSSDEVVFHSGTAIKDGQLVTAGGRVLAVTAAAATLEDALHKAYGALAGIRFEGMQYRRDIAWRALKN
ncbi:phosphoribosylamine--glycine ligase [Granulicella sp. WH15]|uniref:phosphoribosylamine--glycine ligase n=1 Tax=Granulicella sp. WH15 TaxID=2602070 RepID=UPI0013668F7A|nr:phosphoribosylamine--glycine ligase [Granulicella sp. WH15]QHN02477.1 phosphoribosylamine--glycine ligase [Granulicella sp. WH15]